MIEPAIRALLHDAVGNADSAAASTALVALVGDRIRPTESSQVDGNPKVCYQVVDAVQEDCLDEPAQDATDSVQVDVYADTYAQAKAIAVLVRTALHYQAGTFGGVKVTVLLHDGTTDQTPPATLGEEKREYHFVIQFHGFFEL